MNPTRTQLHIDRPLTDMSIAYTQNAADFIATRVLPSKNVSKQSDKYFVYQANAFMRDDAKLRGPGDESAKTGFSLSTDTYFCDKYSLGEMIAYDDIANADEPISLENDAMEVVTHGLLIRREKLFAAACFASSVWGTTVDGAATAKWDDYMSSDPIRAVDSAKKLIRLNGARDANKLVVGMDVFLALKEHPDIIDRVKYTSAESVAEAIIARYLGVDEVLVAKALVDSNVEGASAASVDFVLSSKSALLLHAPAAVGNKTPSAGVLFNWTGAPHLPRPNGIAMRKLDMPEKQALVVEGDITLDCKVTGTGLGVFFANIVG
jgi:hypothetical protein